MNLVPQMRSLRPFVVCVVAILFRCVSEQEPTGRIRFYALGLGRAAGSEADLRISVDDGRFSRLLTLGDFSPTEIETPHTSWHTVAANRPIRVRVSFIASNGDTLAADAFEVRLEKSWQAGVLIALDGVNPAGPLRQSGIHEGRAIPLREGGRASGDTLFIAWGTSPPRTQ